MFKCQCLTSQITAAVNTGHVKGGFHTNDFKIAIVNILLCHCDYYSLLSKILPVCLNSRVLFETLKLHDLINVCTVCVSVRNGPGVLFHLNQRSVMAVSHVMDTEAHTHTHGESEIENPVGLSRHYEEKVKVLKKTNERALYSLHPSLYFLSLPPTFWKIPCCHLLRRCGLSTNEMAGKLREPEKKE